MRLVADWRWGGDLVEVENGRVKGKIAKGHKEIWGVMDIAVILIVVKFLWVYVKTYPFLQLLKMDG